MRKGILSPVLPLCPFPKVSLTILFPHARTPESIGRVSKGLHNLLRSCSGKQPFDQDSYSLYEALSNNRVPTSWDKLYSAGMCPVSKELASFPTVPWCFCLTAQGFSDIYVVSTPAKVVRRRPENAPWILSHANVRLRLLPWRDQKAPHDSIVHASAAAGAPGLVLECLARSPEPEPVCSAFAPCAKTSFCKRFWTACR